MFRYLALVLCLFCSLNSFASDRLVDHTTVQLIELGSTDILFSRSLKRHVPNHAAVSKTLRKEGVTEALESQTALRIKDGILYKTPNCVIKVTLPLTSATTEAHRLNSLKSSAKQKPFAGFSMLFPTAIYMPYSETANLTDDPSHILITPRVKSVKLMKSIMISAMVEASSPDLAMIYSFGYRLGQFQAASLRRAGVEYVSDVHFKLSHKDIIPTKLWSFGNLGEFSIKENQHVIRGHEYQPCSIAVDPIFFLLNSMVYGIMDPKFSALLPAKQKDNMKAYVATFFHGYILAFDDDVTRALKNFFSSKHCIDRFLAHGKFPAPRLPYRGSEEKFYDEVFFPATASAFRVHEIPPQLPYIFPDFYPEILRHPLLVGMETKAPKGFDTKSYCELYPEFVKDAPKFMMHTNKYALFQYLHWGRKAGLIYFDEPVVVPEGFNAEAYLEMYPEIAQEAAKIFMSPLNYAKYHYFKWGRKDKSRLVLLQPLDLPYDFDPARYVELWPNLKQEAARFKIPLLVYTKVQYVLWGHKAKQAYK